MVVSVTSSGPLSVYVDKNVCNTRISVNRLMNAHFGVTISPSTSGRKLGRHALSVQGCAYTSFKIGFTRVTIFMLIFHSLCKNCIVIARKYYDLTRQPEARACYVPKGDQHLLTGRLKLVR